MPANQQKIFISYINSACLEIWHDFLLSANFFSKITFSNNSFRIAIRVANSLDADQSWRFVGPDLDPNYLQSLSADDNS